MLHQLEVDESAAGTRLDVWLEGRLVGCSRSLVARCIKDGRCTIMPGKAKPGWRLRGGEAIAIEVPELQAPEDLLPESMPLAILHEDEHLLVVNKPPGLVVHPAVGHPRGTLLNGLLGYAADRWVPQLVHRLDEDTSGVIACAKSAAAHAFCQQAFKDRTTVKRYCALVHGVPRSDRLECTAHLGRHPKDFRKRACLDPDRPTARDAQTTFIVRQRHDGYSVVEARPRTGRTHQIRVHLQALKHPILADRLYGRGDRWPLQGTPRLQRQALHAWGLRLPHPAGGVLTCHAPLPADLRPLIDGEPLPLDWE